jgi:hypothetical protein
MSPWHYLLNASTSAIKAKAMWQILLKNRKSIVVANWPKYQRHLRLTLIAAADRFRTRSVESEVYDESPRPHLKTAPTALKKLGRADTPTFSTESARSGLDHGRRDRSPGDRFHADHASSSVDLRSTQQVRRIQIARRCNF